MEIMPLNFRPGNVSTYLASQAQSQHVDPWTDKLLVMYLYKMKPYTHYNKVLTFYMTIIIKLHCDKNTHESCVSG